MKEQVINNDSPKPNCSSKEAILANTIADYWIERKIPSSKQTTLDEELQEFKAAVIKKLLSEKPSMIHNGNIFFRELPYAPTFPWMAWMYIDWANFVLRTKQETITVS